MPDNQSEGKNIASSITFKGYKGFLLARLLQLKPVRFHRTQLGWVENPSAYEKFVADVVGRRIESAGCSRWGIFGTGEHTRVVLRALPWLLERVRCFADNNPRLHGQMFMDRPVYAPGDAVKECDGFFLSTAVFQSTMHRDLKHLGFRGPILAVDDKVPPQWFLLREKI